MKLINYFFIFYFFLFDIFINMSCLPHPKIEPHLNAKNADSSLDSILQIISKFIKNTQNAAIIEKVLSILQIQRNYLSGKVASSNLNLQEIQQIRNLLIEIKGLINQLGIENDKSQVLLIITNLEATINEILVWSQTKQKREEERKKREEERKKQEEAKVAKSVQRGMLLQQQGPKIISLDVLNSLREIYKIVFEFKKKMKVKDTAIIEKVLSILSIQEHYFVDGSGAHGEPIVNSWPLLLDEIQQVKNSLIEIKGLIYQLGTEIDKSQVLLKIIQLEYLMNFSKIIPGQPLNMQIQQLQQVTQQSQQVQQQKQFGQMSYNINNEQEFISIMNNLLAAGGAKGIILLNYREFVNSWDNQFVVLIKKLLEDPNIVNSYLLPNKIYVFYLNSFVQSAQDLAIKINLADKSGNHPVMYGISFSGMQQLMASNLNSLKLNQINNAGQVPSINDFYNKIKSIFQI